MRRPPEMLCPGLESGVTVVDDRVAGGTGESDRKHWWVLQVGFETEGTAIFDTMCYVSNEVRTWTSPYLTSANAATQARVGDAMRACSLCPCVRLEGAASCSNGLVFPAPSTAVYLAVKRRSLAHSGLAPAAWQLEIDIR